MEHILLIEDNLADVALIQSYLRDASFTHRLYKAKSLQEGLELIRHHAITLVLLDLALDDTAGFFTLKMFLQEVPDVPVIVLTGTSNEVLGMQIINAGAQDYLVKGKFDGKQLSRAIRHSLKRFAAQVDLRLALWEAQRRERRHQILHHLCRLGSWEMNVLDNSMVWSNEMYHLLGYHPHSFAPKLSDYLRMVHLEDREAVKDFFQEVTRHSHPMELQHRAMVNNRMVRHLALKAQVIPEEKSDQLLLIGTLQDITEFKNAEPPAQAASEPDDFLPETNGTAHSNGHENLLERPIQMLVVEHQTIVQIALKRMLQNSLPQINLDFVEDVPNGVQKLAEKDYDLVLLDVQLPTTEPTQAVSALQSTKDVALLALASEFSKKDRSVLRQLGVKAFLTKPPQRDALVQCVQAVLND